MGYVLTEYVAFVLSDDPQVAEQVADGIVYAIQLEYNLKAMGVEIDE